MYASSAQYSIDTVARTARPGAFAGAIMFCASLLSPQAAAAPERTDLTLGFITLTDMAALAVAAELGYFEDEGLNVSLLAQPDWQTLIEGVASGELDGAHMLPGQALATAIQGDASSRIVTPFSMDLNGNAITVSNEIWAGMKGNIEAEAGGKPAHPISASALKPLADERLAAGKPLNLGMVFPVSTHSYELRYWLAAGGIHPGFYGESDDSGQIEGEVALSVIPPPKMPDMVAAGEIDGFCVGEPWNQQAVADGVGVPLITDGDIWHNNPEKVFGMKQSFMDANPGTTQALLRASFWLDQNDDVNRGAVAAMISIPDYVGADPAFIGASMTGTFEYEAGDVREHFDFNVYHREPTDAFIDGVPFNGRTPNAYLESLDIGMKQDSPAL